MLKNIEDCLIKYNVSEKSILVAFSGGYDSTVLLHILLKFRKKYNFKLSAIHLNHNWRDKESDKEQEFCENFCKSNNIEFYTQKLEKNATSNELEAREARYKFFKEIYKKNNFDLLLTAHTKSDNAETVIFRLSKGMGINGLKGIQEYSKLYNMNVLRPLISVSREEIENYIKINNITVNFDSSNANKKYKRNKVRLDIVPHFKELSEKFEENILNTSKIAGFYDKSIDYLIDKLNIFSDKKIKISEFKKQPEELQYIILYKFLSINNIEINFKQIDSLLYKVKENIPNSGKYFSIEKYKFVFVSKNTIEIFENKDDDINKYSLKISTAKEKVTKFSDGTKNYIYANKNALKEPLKLRHRVDGDIFQPFGMEGKMKLKKFLNMKAIPKFERDRLILLTNSKNEILWIYPVATSELVRVKDENYVRIELSYD